MFEIKLKDHSSCKWEMFGQIHPLLGQVFYDFCVECMDMGLTEITITSIIRMGDPGVHGYGRGIDISIRNIPETILDIVVSNINNKYPYDTKRPDFVTALVHTSNDFKTGGDIASHLHLQVYAKP